MKKSVVFFLIILIVIPSLLAFNWNEFFNTITGRASTSNTNVSIQVLVPLPNLTIVVPQNTTYNDNSSLSLNFTTQYATTIWYHIDSGANVTITGNTTFNVSEGGHILFLYANNTDQNTSRVNVSFNINTSAVTEDSGSGSSGGGGGGRGRAAATASSNKTSNETSTKVKKPDEKKAQPTESAEEETPQQRDCKEWSECQAKYDIENLIANTVILRGESYCLENPTIKKSCNPKKDISTKKIQKCATEFVEVYENEKLISRLEVKNEDIKIVNIDLAVDNKGYCNYCYDGIKNFDEEEKDCGGSCAPCTEFAIKDKPSKKQTAVPSYHIKYCEIPYELVGLLIVLLLLAIFILLKYIRFYWYKIVLANRNMHFFSGYYNSKETAMRIIGIILSILMIILSVAYMFFRSSCSLYYILFLSISVVLFLLFMLERIKKWLARH